ncbi:putative HVA22-like protein g isoform X2 [Juglans microcarpa x Juglans regia]|uniref:putative HVA22-like protein g isoform X2 n=1 Tax=Juglans microcarpa x Juglans regia TaxID=2249226 RepID=UPI001B7E6E1E|nr:putative HVA22-like protein g isoform X2 [Juglans microcarpa x Juglans regia]
MIGSFLTRGLVMIFGYAYPAYECFKTVEKNKPEIEQLLFWCQYWILVAVLTVCERIGDAFISWVPMYSEAKLAFFIYLWYPKTKGTTYVYDSFFRPYVAKHETEIDRNLLELRTRAADIAILYWQRAASYGQTRMYDILQYVAAQSTPQRRPPQQPSARINQRAAPPNRQPASPAQPQTEEPPSPTSSTSSSQHHEEEEAGSSLESKAANPPAAAAGGGLDPQKATVPSEAAIQAAPTEAEPKPMQIEEEEEEEAAAAPSATEDNTNPAPKETLMEEAIRSTRVTLRKTRSVGKPSKNDS